MIVPPAAYLRLIPHAVTTLSKDQTHTVSVWALDNAGQALAGLPLTLAVTGGHP